MNKENNKSEKTPLILSLFLSVLILGLHFIYLFTNFTHPLIVKMMEIFIRTGLFDFHHKPQLLALLFGAFYALGIKGIKSEHINIAQSLGLLVLGMLLYGGSYFSLILDDPLGRNLYIAMVSIGYLLLMTGFIYLKRIIHHNLFKDQFNKQNRLFRQEKRKIENAYSVNLPTEKGWLNIINPFRGTMVLGTPGSGKSYTIVEEFIKQHIQKGMAMLLYDFKYPALSSVAYNYYLRYYEAYDEATRIYMVNFDAPRQSHRINPISPHLLRTQSDALAASESLFLNINKEYIKKKDFFTSSGVNLLASIIWFLRQYKEGKYCTIPHAIAFLNEPDSLLFKTLDTQTEVRALLAPFRDALVKKANEQLAGQTASARIPLARLSTKALFWIFGADQVPLDINNPKQPALLFLANSPQSQSSYSAAYGLIASSIVRGVNQQNRHPLSLIVDELPTIYINGLDNLIATARSNKISTLLSFQDLAQLERDYGKEVANTIFNTVGNKISGAVVAETAKKLSDMIGKSVQKRGSINYSSKGTSVGISTTLDYLIPPEAIAQLSQGEFCGVLADSFEQKLEQKIFYSKIKADKRDLTKHPIPKLNEYTAEAFEAKMTANYDRIYQDIKDMIVELTLQSSPK